MKIDYGEAACQSLSEKILDDCITAMIFKALRPAALEIRMAAAEDQVIERQNQQKYCLRCLGHLLPCRQLTAEELTDIISKRHYTSRGHRCGF